MNVFGYGSLLWNPGFRYAARRPALAVGWRRSWCVPSTHHRGTPEFPGVVLGLLPGGTCVGTLFEVEDDRAEAVHSYLKAREEAEDGYAAATINLITPEGRAMAHCWVADQTSPAVKEPSFGEIVYRIENARGSSGANADYLRRTFEALASLEVPVGWPQPCGGLPRAQPAPLPDLGDFRSIALTIQQRPSKTEAMPVLRTIFRGSLPSD